MNMTLKMSGCGAIMTVAAMLLAQNEVPKTIKVVGLEDDKDNATVVAPAELGAKPATVSVSADALATAAAADSRAKAEARANTANVKALTVEGMVIPPSSDLVKTLEEAIRNILVQAAKQVGTVSSNGIEKLTMPYQQLGDGKSYEVEWRKALRLLLSPVGYNFTEDGELVLFGLSEEVDAKHKQLAQERLTANRTPILFTTNESEGGMELRNAIRDVSVKADVTITTDYMEPADLYVPTQAAATEGTLSAAEIGKAKEKATVQQAQVKRTRFDTNGQQIEWRTVLREILNPHDYDFVEIGGVVRVAKRAKIAEWEKEKEMAKPLSSKVVLVHHANPETVVERLGKMKLLRHPNASVQVVAKKDDKHKAFDKLQSGGGLQSANGTQMGMNSSSFGSSSVFQDLKRPQVVPAILIYDIEENIALVEQKIKEMDIGEKQVLIEVIIFSVDDHNGDNEVNGIDWKQTFRNLSIGGVWEGDYDYKTSDLVSRNSPRDDSYGQSTSLTFRNADTPAAQAESASVATEGASEGESGSESTATKNGKTRELISEAYRKYSRERTTKKSWTRDSLKNNHFNITYGPIEFDLVLNLISERTDSRLLSNPMLVLGDHSDSVIQVGRQVPIPHPSYSSFDRGGSTATDNFSLEWLSVMDGISLWVSPEITPDGKGVRLAVHPQWSQKEGDVEFVYRDSVMSYPEMSIQELDTRVTVPSGNTLLLGGLIKTTNAKTESKVWLLGDIPWIGRIFRWQTPTVKRENLMILLKPTILEDGAPDTGYEKPTLKYTDKDLEDSGRNLKLRYQETGEWMRKESDEWLHKGENAIKKTLGIKKEEDASVEPQPADAAKPAEPAEADSSPRQEKNK